MVFGSLKVWWGPATVPVVSTGQVDGGCWNPGERRWWFRHVQRWEGINADIFWK